MPGGLVFSVGRSAVSKYQVERELARLIVKTSKPVLIRTFSVLRGWRGGAWPRIRRRFNTTGGGLGVKKREIGDLVPDKRLESLRNKKRREIMETWRRFDGFFITFTSLKALPRRRER